MLKDLSYDGDRITSFITSLLTFLSSLQSFSPNDTTLITSKNGDDLTNDDVTVTSVVVEGKQPEMTSANDDVVLDDVTIDPPAAISSAKVNTQNEV